MYLCSFRHDNILPLYGFSIGGEKAYLVCQYMRNGSLENQLQYPVSFINIDYKVILLNSLNKVNTF